MMLVELTDREAHAVSMQIACGSILQMAQDLGLPIGNTAVEVVARRGAKAALIAKFRPANQEVPESRRQP